MIEMLTTKGTHLVHILSTGAAGMYAETMIPSVNPSQIVTTLQIITQLVIAVVTAYAAIRKTFQKPGVVVKGEAESV